MKNFVKLLRFLLYFPSIQQENENYILKHFFIFSQWTQSNWKLRWEIRKKRGKKSKRSNKFFIKIIISLAYQSVNYCSFVEKQLLWIKSYLCIFVIINISISLDFILFHVTQKMAFFFFLQVHQWLFCNKSISPSSTC